MLIRRLLILIPLILGIIAFVFIVMQFAPTDPATAAFNGGNPTAEQLQQFKEENGLLDPLPLQYVHFVTDLVSGNMGDSLISGTPVLDSISTALPLTIQLTVLGLVIAIVLSLIFGVTSALFRDRWPDQVIRVISLGGVAAPSFWLALLMIQYLAVQLGWFPTLSLIHI